MKITWGSVSATGRSTWTVSRPLTRAGISIPISRHRRGAQAPGARLHAGDAALAAQDLPDRSPLEDPRAELGCATPEALDRAGGIRVAALGLPGGGADVVDVREGLQVVELARRQRGGVDADAPQHLDVLAERVGIRGRDDVHESGVREHRRSAHDLGPV